MHRSTSHPTNEVTELAKERNRAAAERTLASWINTSLLLIGFGVMLEEIPVLLHPTQNQAIVDLRLGYSTALSAIALGITLLIPVAMIHRRSLQALEQSDYLKAPISLIQLSIMVGSVFLFGLVALAGVFLVLSRL